VRSALRGGLISSVNWSEVVQKVGVKGRATTELRRLFEQLGLIIVPFEASTAERAASLYPQTRALSLSLGDRACLALGLERDLPVLTADRSWSGLALHLDIRPIR
jgi:ribonuclease VapC